MDADRVGAAGKSCRTRRAVRCAGFGTILRIAFIALLLVVTVRVSLPQNETIWTVYDTPGDLIRMALGFVVCLWLAFQFFAAPKDAHSHRMWLYIGAAALPFAAICVIAIW